MTKLIVVGTGGHADSVADAANSAGFRVVGFLDVSPNHLGTSPEKLALLEEVDLASTALALGIGTNFHREDFYVAIKKRYPRANFPPVVHQSAWVSSLARLQESTVVMSMASVGPHCNVGVGSLINTGSSLDHHSQMASFSSLGPGARVGGKAKIGERSVIGLNSGVLQTVSIGSDTVIGAHSLASKDTPENLLAFGIPAAIVRKRAREDPYY